MFLRREYVWCYGVGGLISQREGAQPGGKVGCRKTMTNVYAGR